MGAYVWPCPGYSRVSSKFGNRTCPFHGKEFHDGVDLAAPAGTAVYAAGSGTVTKAGKNGEYGNYISIDHGGGMVSFYAHCKALYVKQGAKVTAGRKIAAVGSTGSSTGNHLHFGMHKNGEKVNPLSYVSPSDTADNYSEGSSGSGSGAGSGSVDKSEKKDIASVVLKSVSGTANVQKSFLRDMPVQIESGIEILIQNDKVYMPCVEGEIRLERSRKGAPSRLTFTVLKDGTLNFQEGNPVSFKYNGEEAFYGFVFSKSRSDGRLINVTCYDQLRYLKSKDTLSYVNKTYSEVLKMIAADYGLVCGSVEDTGYKIPSRIEEGALIDILLNASDLTVVNTGKLFVLYDDFGKLTLKNIESMKLDVLVDEDTAQGYDYQSSIDSDTYTRIKLAVDNEDTGEREVHVLNDGFYQGYWGRLQYYEKLDAGTEPALINEKAKALLKYYCKKNRKLTVKDVLGDIRVRGGSAVAVRLGLGDINVSNYMCVENVAHKFENGFYTMDLSLSGIRGEFSV